jgi:hypothetical protein
MRIGGWEESGNEAAVEVHVVGGAAMVRDGGSSPLGLVLLQWCGCCERAGEEESGTQNGSRGRQGANQAG